MVFVHLVLEIERERKITHYRNHFVIFIDHKGYIYIGYKLLTLTNLDPKKVDLRLGDETTSTHIHGKQPHIE